MFNDAVQPAGDTWVLICAEDREINMGDQKMIENELHKAGIKSLRASLLTVMKHGQITEKGVLNVMGRDICIVYFRTGYSDF